MEGPEGRNIINMNCDSQPVVKEEIEPQYRFDVESDVLWIDTLYWTFEADFKKMEVGHRIYSKYVKFSSIPNIFYLEIEKISKNKFVVDLIREVTDQDPDSDYFLQVSFSLVASTCPRKVSYMDCEADNAPVYFTMDEFHKLNGINDVWMMKCVVWMYEHSQLDNERKTEQQRMWQMKLKEVAPNNSQYEQMAFLMGRSTFKTLFTGRQDDKFADHKSTLLIRSFRYSDKLVSNVGKHQNQRESQESVMELGRLLGYIKTGQERCISRKDCILLYASAYYCGLSYLKLQCSEYIKRNLTDVDFFIDVLIASDMVNDQDLLDYALDWFLKNKKKVLGSVQWNNFKNRNYELARGFKLLFLKWEANDREEELEHVKSFIRIQE